MADWTDNEDRTLSRLHAQGLYDPEIAARMPGRTVGAVTGRRIRLGLKGHKTKPTTPPELLDRLRALAEQGGLSAGAIAPMIGRSASAVIGLCHRHGIQLAGDHITGGRKGAKAVKKARSGGKPKGWEEPLKMSRAEREQRAEAAKERAEEHSAAMQERLDKAAEGALRLPLVSVQKIDYSQFTTKRSPAKHYDVRGVTMDQCKFPLNAGLPQEFCGKPALAGSSYCEAHHGICVHGTADLSRVLKRLLQ